MTILAAAALLATTAAGAQQETIYPVGGDVKPPAIVKRCDPVMPEMPRKQRPRPFFMYEAVITSRGELRSLRLVKGPARERYRSLDQSFRTAIRCSRFRPATRHGKAVACRYFLTITVDVR